MTMEEIFESTHRVLAPYIQHSNSQMIAFFYKNILYFGNDVSLYLIFSERMCMIQRSVSAKLLNLQEIQVFYELPE